jgi:uncharacterized protein (DUF169 family)
MNDFQTISQNLVKSLSLQYEPVGVLLYQETDPLPADVPFTQKEYKTEKRANGLQTGNIRFGF